MLPLLALLIADPAFAGAKASAFKPENKKGTNYWNAGSAIDGKMETAWFVPGESPNRGEWIELDVPKGTVDKLAIVGGWDKDETAFKDYPRLKQVRVDIYTIDNEQNAKQVGTATLSLADQRGWQVLDLPDTEVGIDSFFGGKLRLSIVDIYDGDDYPNFGLSEVAVHMKEMDAQPKISAISTSTTGSEADLADGNVKTVWTGPAAGAEITVQPMGWAVSSIGFQGDKAQGRAKTVTVKVGTIEQTYTLADKPDLQWIQLPAFNGYIGSVIDDVVITIVDSHPSAAGNVGFQELKFKASYFESL